MSYSKPSHSLAYAETHYRFGLPLGRLFRPWPEIQVDGPSLCVPGQIWQPIVVVRDAHLFPVRAQIQAIHARREDGLELKLPGQDLGLLDQPFDFRALDLGELPGPGLWKVWFEFDLERSNGQRQHFWNHNLPGLEPWPLEWRFLTSAMPQFEQWCSVDLHTHSWATSDQVEFGPNPEVYRSAARVMGLDVVAITDHSYDFAWDSVHYMSPTDPNLKFAQYGAEVRTHNLPSQPLLLWGEEVSCGNHLGQNVHLLVYGCPNYIPGQGDGGRKWFKNHPDLTISEVLDRCEGYPAYAAHPGAQAGLAEKLIFRRGNWSLQDLEDRLSGMQWLSGRWGKMAQAGQSLWLQALQQGKIFLPGAGSDAHGDLNHCYGVQIPLWSLKAGHRNLFARVRTHLPVPRVDETSLLQALQGPTSCVSDGPVLRLQLEGLCQGLSNQDWGDWTHLTWQANFGQGIVQGRLDLGSTQFEERLWTGSALWAWVQGCTHTGAQALVFIRQ